MSRICKELDGEAEAFRTLDEDEAFWSEFLRDLVRRGLSGVQLVISDAHAGLKKAVAKVLAYMAFPDEHWRQIHSTNPLERQNREIRRRTRVIGIFPHRASTLRLVTMLMWE